MSIGYFSNFDLGANVHCVAIVLITDSDWHQDDYRSGEHEPVRIHDDVWIGYSSLVVKGVTIGKNSVIGAGSVVTRNIPANVVAAGNPCRVIKELDRSDKVKNGDLK